MTTRTGAFDGLIDEATAHYVRLQAAPRSRRYRKALSDWITQSDDHAKAMDLVRQIWVASKAVTPPSASRRPSRAPAPARRFGYGLAGSLGAAVAGLGALLFTVHLHHVYSTTSYRTASLIMADGTTVIMGPRTSLRIDDSVFSRSISLDQGVADIRVRHGLRGLHTYLRGLRVDDLGTHFVVANDADRASVTLISGAVALLNPQTGQELTRLAPGGIVSWARWKDQRKTTPRDTYQSLAWEDHVIEFDDTPLPEAVEQLHDFTGVNVSLRGEAASSIKISGTFSYDKPSIFFQSLRTIYDADVTQTKPNNYVIKVK
jgi:transmembrane sensor